MLDPSQPLPDGWQWLVAVREALARAPDPDHAAKLCAKLLEAAPEQLLRDDANRHPLKFARILFALCGIAPFLAPRIVHHPDWLGAWLADDLSRPRDPDEIAKRLDARLAARGDPDPATTLRHFKYFELARLTIRDACEEWVPLAASGTTLREISQLANLLLDRALAMTRAVVDTKLAPPRWRDQAGEERRLRFCVLGLGKLGAEELNYSSDVDLIYVCDTTPEDGGSLRGSDPTVYFARLAQEFGKLVAASTTDGFLYRVDLDLRPEGAQGNLVVSHAALCDYYEAWADTWEKAAFMKARPVAGDHELGWSVIRAIDPMIYHATMNFRVVEGIRSLKEKISSVRGGGGAAFDVKIDPGGIRDIEFVAQVLQLLHGGKIPQIRDRSTQRALHKLAEVGLLVAEEMQGLLDAYRYLRRVENRLQMEAERQVHRLPTETHALLRLARAVGHLEEDAVAQFESELQHHRRFLLDLLATSFGEGNRERIMELFQNAVPSLLAFGSSRLMVEELADAFAREVDACADSQRALNNLDRFIRGTGTRRFYYELLLDRTELVKRLTLLFGASNYLSDYLARHPRLIEPVFRDPDTLLLDRAALEKDFEEVQSECRRQDTDDLESDLDALRLFHHRQVLNVGLLDLADEVNRMQAETALTEIAEVCIAHGLETSRNQLGSGGDPPEVAAKGAFLVVGMGKLASRELTHGSDLDLIFLYSDGAEQPGSDAEAQAVFIRLAQRFISSLHTATALGNCYEVDARLRPSGNQGMLVTSIQAFERYHAGGAAVWERQALLRARPVGGDAALGALFERTRIEILSKPLPDDLAEQIHRVRGRMENELARETSRQRNYKTGRGGALDVECAVQYLQLRSGPAHPEFFAPTRIETHLERLRALGLIEPDAATSLLEGWDFLQRIGHRLRIVENRSISEIDLESGGLDSLALQIGYPDTGREGGARRALLSDYEAHTERIRSAYESILAISN